jgi:hypothetical protein
MVQRDRHRVGWCIIVPMSVRRLYAEAKGRTTSIGLDVDTQCGHTLNCW